MFQKTEPVQRLVGRPSSWLCDRRYQSVPVAAIGVQMLNDEHLLIAALWHNLEVYSLGVETLRIKVSMGQKVIAEALWCWRS